MIEPGTLTMKQTAFLAAFAECGIVARAARAARINRASHYDWLEDPAYRKRFEVAQKQAIVSWEDEAVRRAFVGVRKPVYRGGKKVGTVLEFSDGLAQFLLKANNREKYGDRSALAVTGGLTLETMQANMIAARRRAKLADAQAGAGPEARLNPTGET